MHVLSYRVGFFTIILKCVFQPAENEPSTSVRKEELGSANVIALLVF